MNTRDTLTEIHQATFVVVTRGDLYPKAYNYTVTNSAELQEAVMTVKRSNTGGDVVHTVLLFDKRMPIVMHPGRGSNALQALYAELRS